MKTILGFFAISIVLCGLAAPSRAQAQDDPAAIQQAVPRHRAAHVVTEDDLPAAPAPDAPVPAAKPSTGDDAPRPMKDIQSEQNRVQTLIASTQDKVEHSSGEYRAAMAFALQGFQQRMDDLKEEQRQRELLDKAEKERRSEKESASAGPAQRGR
jgi:hypothetical protein